jgi:hypothetical protein
MGPRLSLSRHTQDCCRAISRLKYDPSVNQTAKSYFMLVVNKKHKQSETKLDGSPKIQWCELKVVTSKHEDCHLMFTKPWKRGWNIPSKRDSKAQNKDQRSIVTACTNTYNRIDVFSTLRTQQCNIKMKLNHPSISTKQGNQVSLLPSAH